MKKILEEFDDRLWKTGNGNLQLRMFSLEEAEAVRGALSATAALPSAAMIPHDLLSKIRDELFHGKPSSYEVLQELDSYLSGREP